MKIGPYTTVRVLGKGAEGVVHEAVAPDGRHVAVKLLPGALDGDARLRLERERSLLADLGETAGFVTLLDWGSDPSGPYLVFPLLEGGTLRDRLRSGALPIPAAIEIGHALASALGRAHARGIVHRDVKPENVLFGADGRPLVADLGLAKIHAKSSRPRPESLGFSQTGRFAGTAGYMAPEQFDDAKAVGPPADVFALGAVLWELLTGKPAFPGNLIQVAAAVEEGRILPVWQLRPDVPRWLDAVVLRALARDPAARFADGTELAGALAAGETTAPRRGPLVAAALAAIALLAVVAIGLTAWLVAHVRAPRPAPTPAPAAISTPAPTPAPTRKPLSEADRLFEQGRARGALARQAHARGDTAACTSEIRAGLAELDRVLKLAPERREALVARADLRRLDGDVSGALEDYRRLTANDEPDVDSWIGRAMGEAAVGDREMARRAYDRAVALGKDDPVCWEPFFYRASFRLDDADVAGAERDGSEAIARAELGTVGSKEGSIWSVRAVARAQLGRTAEAIEDLDRALSLHVEPADPLVRFRDELKARLSQLR